VMRAGAGLAGSAHKIAATAPSSTPSLKHERIEMFAPRQKPEHELCRRRPGNRRRGLETRWYHFSVNRAGYVLVGGRSSRMGRDKALLPYRAEVLGSAVARVVARAAGTAVLVGNPLRYGHLGYPVIPDLYPDEGPLGGILAALAHSSAEWNLVAACDMPHVTAAFLCAVLEAAERSGADSVLPAGPAGRLEPLCAAYHRRSLWALEAAFARGVRQVAEALDELRTVCFPAGEVSLFQNVNTPQDWLAYAAD
jgi:molybdenum cofactor guanylyltransferase